MAKYAVALLALFALVAVCSAKPMGMGMVHKNHHISHSSVVSPFLGYGGYGIGHTVSHHSVGHVMPHWGLGMHHHMGMKGLYGMYPGMGLGYGFIG